MSWNLRSSRRTAEISTVATRNTQTFQPPLGEDYRRNVVRMGGRENKRRGERGE